MDESAFVRVLTSHRNVESAGGIHLCHKRRMAASTFYRSPRSARNVELSIFRRIGCLLSGKPARPLPSFSANFLFRGFVEKEHGASSLIRK
jgi:hypothetical protein